MNALNILKERFGHGAFRGEQEKIIDSILEGRDVFCIKPSGWGKSICWKVASMMSKGITVIVDPSETHIQERILKLKYDRVESEFIDSSLSKSSVEKVLYNIKIGRCRRVFVVPKKINDPRLIDILKNKNIAMVVIEQPQRISKWDYYYDKTYNNILEFISAMPVRPVIAVFAAEVAARVRGDIISAFSLGKAYCPKAEYIRPNLYYSVIRTYEKLEDVREIAERHKGHFGMIYCKDWGTVLKVFFHLDDLGFSVAMFDTQLSDVEKEDYCEGFNNGNLKIMVTSGLYDGGFDRDDIRFIVHYDVPKDFETYLAQTGRAGRDGKPADCVLLYNDEELFRFEYLINLTAEQYGDRGRILHNVPTEERNAEKIIGTPPVMYNFEKLRQVVDYIRNKRCMHIPVKRYFGLSGGGKCGFCRRCTKTELYLDLPADGECADMADSELLAQAFDLRQKIAEEEYVPPYMLLTVSAVEEICRRQPKNDSEFLAVEGVNKFKQELFSRRYLKLIRAFNEEK